MSNVVSGRQLRAARIFAGLTQAQFAKAIGVHERNVRHWELKDDGLPTLTTDLLERIDEVLLQSGVVLSSLPTRTPIRITSST